MKKEKKSRDYYTINSELFEIFLKHIEEHSLSKSKLIEFLIKEYLEKNEK